MADHYFTIEKPATTEFKDRGSRFIAYAYPIKDANEFKQYLQALKKEHPKAVHHCFAYRLGNTNDNFRVSDDGEPSGTAGRPILNQIDSKQLTNVAVIVVRYFGGTLLGVPGLINAYRSVTSMALQLVPCVQKAITRSFLLTFDHTQMNEVMRWVKTFNIEIISQEMQLFCNMKINVPLDKISMLEQLMKDLRDVEMKEI